MRRFIMAVSLASALLVLRAPHSRSASQVETPIPDPTLSDVPCGITLVGTTDGIADSRGEFTIVLRSAHEPVPNADIFIDFGNCVPDIHVSQIQPTSGVFVDCPVTGPMIRITTDGQSANRGSRQPSCCGRSWRGIQVCACVVTGPGPRKHQCRYVRSRWNRRCRPGRRLVMARGRTPVHYVRGSLGLQLHEYDESRRPEPAAQGFVRWGLAHQRRELLPVRAEDL